MKKMIIAAVFIVAGLAFAQDNSDTPSTKHGSTTVETHETKTQDPVTGATHKHKVKKKTKNTVEDKSEAKDSSNDSTQAD